MAWHWDGLHSTYFSKALPHNMNVLYVQEYIFHILIILLTLVTHFQSTGICIHLSDKKVHILPTGQRYAPPMVKVVSMLYKSCV